MNTLNETEVAVALGVSVRTLARWRVAGTGPAFIKVGNKVAYPREAFIEFAANNIELAGVA